LFVGEGLLVYVFDVVGVFGGFVIEFCFVDVCVVEGGEECGVVVCYYWVELYYMFDEWVGVWGVCVYLVFE